MTPWALLTQDMRIVGGTPEDIITISQVPLGLLPRIQMKSVGASTVLGLRLQLLF